MKTIISGKLGQIMKCLRCGNHTEELDKSTKTLVMTAAESETGRAYCKPNEYK
jgi:hypothetical protein